ncbi:hypothetical protein GE21DRAFT_3030 [Neurospora crassa]|uniref:Uncharacterized protein n=2 Tax=Neurospora crassa TaxID=5141 RepID=Q7RUP7_NEUCR|nr:hypothetical protein NCU05470 [Neurospora crassa OR74A]pir/T51011/ hypothetical protein B7J19.100 [imported] - Neurospora crassa [Neurospora crassa]EAA34225.1 hypothetical protein NCU05470 [Neurospora crassa OR74A]KHE85233.1 hypothetical protein GE21DRAFT_3030 [Neurospora crassa]CAE55931.1 conserved hypothetical protein [Neurospora crassa]|eukprot:XP_963461.1 hypothetical protein NCU05470 [Neurospora crassa OR74A]
MPPKPAELAITGTIHGIKPTESDLKILFGIIENLSAPMEADWEAAAQSSGMKDRRSFMVMYRRFRLKYGLPDGAKVTAAAASAADGDSGAAEGEAVETPVKKTASSRKKKPAADEGDSGDLLTPTTFTPDHTGLISSTNNFNLNDNMDFVNHEQPDTPSKSTTTASGKKRNATEANPDATPARKKPTSARKPRTTAKQKREAAAAAAAAAAEVATTAAEDPIGTIPSFNTPIPSPMFPTGTTVGDAAGIDATMEDMGEPGSEAAEALDLALEANAAAEAEATSTAFI